MNPNLFLKIPAAIQGLQEDHDLKRIRRIKLDVVAHIVIPALGKLMQEDKEFETSMSSTVNSRSTWDT